MSYKELLEKYKAGTATPEERASVEDDLEKYESINEYLAGGLDEALPAQASNVKNDVSSGKRVRWNILKKFILTAAITLALGALALVTVFFVISPLMDRNAYQPLQSLTKENYGITKLFIDLAAYTELHFPGIHTSEAWAEPLGFGKYDVEMGQWNVMNSRFERYSCSIDGKHFVNLTHNFNQYPYANAFRHCVYLFDDMRDNGDAAELEEIGKLPETAFIKTYVSFKDDLSIDDVLKIRGQFPDSFFGWIAVRCCEKDVQQVPQIGFDPTGTGVIIPEDAVNQEKYPNFELSWLDHPLDSTALSTHLISLLKYMADNMDFLELLNDPRDIYSKSLEYLDKNGIKSYGVMVIGSSKDVLTLRGLPEVESLILDDVKLSRYSK